jgi:hypothetical protein
MKGPMAGSPEDRSKTMKLISTYELNKCSDSELSGRERAGAGLVPLLADRSGNGVIAHQRIT